MGTKKVQASQAEAEGRKELDLQDSSCFSWTFRSLASPVWSRLDAGSRMSREAHVRFWESVGVQFPRATHIPLNRQSEIYAREGVDLDRSTLAGWVGATSQLLSPLVEALRRHVMAAAKIHADDTPVPVLAPGRGRTKIGRLWTYVRDDRPAGVATPPAVWFAYTPDRKTGPRASLLAWVEGRTSATASQGLSRHLTGGCLCWFWTSVWNRQHSGSRMYGACET